MARIGEAVEHEADDEVSVIAALGFPISFNISLARRIVAAHPRKPTRYRLTADGRQPLLGGRATAQRAADAAEPGIIGQLDGLILVLDGRSRMDAAEGLPRFFPVYALTQDETVHCVVPKSRRALQRLQKVLRSPAI